MKRGGCEHRERASVHSTSQSHSSSGDERAPPVAGAGAPALMKGWISAAVCRRSLVPSREGTVTWDHTQGKEEGRTTGVGVEGHNAMQQGGLVDRVRRSEKAWKRDEGAWGGEGHGREGTPTRVLLVRVRPHELACTCNANELACTCEAT